MRPVVTTIRKQGRNCAIRLIFVVLVVVSVSLTVLINTQVISHHFDQDPTDNAPILRNLTQSQNNQSLPMQDVIEPSPSPQSSPLPNISSIGMVDEATIPNTPSTASPTNHTNMPLVVQPKMEILDEKNSTLHKQLSMHQRRPKQHNQLPPKPKRQIVQRGVQEHELERQLGLTINFSEFDTKALHQSLEEFYNIPNNNNTTNTSYLWDDPQCLLPDWMKKYLRWHSYMRTTSRFCSKSTKITDNNQKPVKFIVMQCLSSDDHCGGVSDRLKPFPLMLRVAYFTQRMLFIYWDRPGRLEEFLLPPMAGLDWRLPPWLVPMVETWSEGVFTFSMDTLRGWSRTDIVMVRTRYQDYHGGMYMYNAHLMEGEIDFVQLFHHLWKIAFTPSPPVRQLIEADMSRLGLIPGQYVGAHLRALYALDSRQDHVLRNWARNAMNCATELRPRKTIFFVSDSDIATGYARDYAVEKNATIITRTPDPDPPLHIDKVSQWRTRKMSDFYDSFVDIYIMAHADCLTYNKGGYGIMGLYMSRNATCGLRQDAIDNPRIRNPCIWVDDPLNGTEATKSSIPLHPVLSNEPIYMEPILDIYWHSVSRDNNNVAVVPSSKSNQVTNETI